MCLNQNEDDSDRKANEILRQGLNYETRMDVIRFGETDPKPLVEIISKVEEVRRERDSHKPQNISSYSYSSSGSSYYAKDQPSDRGYKTKWGPYHRSSAHD
eukprot:GAHX01007667.1.p1 GENE.GAHX01007667.1~~GAHX01007667.1.p1  ORF type:complete len:101 (+),score=3.82 GAHX01007667.1:160-462(+)